MKDPDEALVEQIPELIRKDLKQNRTRCVKKRCEATRIQTLLIKHCIALTTFFPELLLLPNHATFL